MSPEFPAAAPSPHPLVRRLWTGNPFYVVSAGLFLLGLRLSFADPTRDEDNWAAMTCLAGYTLLLAGAALLLVRLADVWDDVRTVLLLVVLMFLATSVTFDELLVMDRARGIGFNLIGLGFAVAVTEALLAGMRLQLPALFRVPFHLTLALFFLYPVGLAHLDLDIHNEWVMWGIWGFSPAAGLVFLTLLPAVRRGPGYVAVNGSPWAWPFYPWSVFVFLAVAVAGRSFLLCRSFHLLGGLNTDVIFAPYFLAPFGLCLAVVLLELGLVAGSRATTSVALAVPALLAVTASVGIGDAPVTREFLGHFTERLGATPLFLALVAAAGFQLYAWVRGTAGAADALTGTLVVLAGVGPLSLTFAEPVAPQPAPLLGAAVVQLAVGLRGRSAGRFAAAGFALAVAAAAALPEETTLGARAAVAFHLVLLTLLGIGAACDGATGRVLRVVGSGVAAAAALAVVVARPPFPDGMASWAGAAYPLVVAAGLIVYGLFLREQVATAAGGVVGVVWVCVSGWGVYAALRARVPGLDFLVVGLALLPLAVLVSLGKSGVLRRWAVAWRGVTDVPR